MDRLGICYGSSVEGLGGGLKWGGARGLRDNSWTFYLSNWLAGHLIY